ncbi:hypothetical protein DUI87_31032 [Hirundo rustica rustica]|uniref:Uncharacterized protein n=1 Tax=Hirundo rustica rustica TaxID=333673 RepID=A0A3M0IVN7_HIRRU|nr:hypothetical protein DUI87_31032 [Hirundo rustica rustica]
MPSTPQLHLTSPTSGPRGFFYYPYTHLCSRAEQLQDKDTATSITQDTTNQGTPQQQKPLRKKNDREDRENSEGDDKRNNNQGPLRSYGKRRER